LFSLNEHDWRGATIKQVKILIKEERTKPGYKELTNEIKIIPIHINKGRLPIHCAVQANAKLEIVQLLYTLNPNGVKTKRYDGFLCVHIAARHTRNHLIPFLLYVYPQSVDIVSSIDFNFHDEEGETNVWNGSACQAIAYRCLVGDRVKDKYNEDETGIISSKTKSKQLDLEKKEILKSAAERAYSLEQISLEAKNYFGTFKTTNIEKDDEARTYKLLPYLNNKIVPIRKKRKSVLELAKTNDKIAEENIFCFFSQEE